MRAGPLVVLTTAILAACGGGGDDSFTFRVAGRGMSPTFENGDVVTVEPYVNDRPERGDVVVLDLPASPERQSIKRIIGLPGETVAISLPDEVAVDGSVLSEPYIRGLTTCHQACMFVIPAAESEEAMAECGSTACYFVMGDNRQNSSDSRQGWLVPLENIAGYVEDE